MKFKRTKPWPEIEFIWQMNGWLVLYFLYLPIQLLAICLMYPFCLISYGLFLIVDFRDVFLKRCQILTIGEMPKCSQ